MAAISTIIITRNVETHLRRCLESVRWANEIIIFDSGSTDNTIAICREFTDKIVETDWPGYGAQKNRAIDKASNEWILAIDADEWLSKSLIANVQYITDQSTPHNAFAIQRRSNYCGKWITHGDWKEDWPVRLFRKTRARFSEDLVHERLLVEGSTGRLDGYIYHNAFANLDEVLVKVNRYSTLSAQQLSTKNKKATLATAIIHGLWTFIRGYIFKGGFLDGKEGFILAFSNAEGTYYRYLKLMYLQQENKKH